MVFLSLLSFFFFSFSFLFFSAPFSFSNSGLLEHALRIMSVISSRRATFFSRFPFSNYDEQKKKLTGRGPGRPRKRDRSPEAEKDESVSLLTAARRADQVHDAVAAATAARRTRVSVAAVAPPPPAAPAPPPSQPAKRTPSPTPMTVLAEAAEDDERPLSFEEMDLPGSSMRPATPPVDQPAPKPPAQPLNPPPPSTGPKVSSPLLSAILLTFLYRLQVVAILSRRPLQILCMHRSVER